MSIQTSPQTEMGFLAELGLPLDDAIERVKVELKTEGFGVLTTIDVRATLKEKIDAEFNPYVILGACNPALAHKALLADKRVGLLLPCNVIVFEENNRTMVNIVNPEIMLSNGLENEQLAGVATEAAIKLRRVAAALGSAV